MIKNRLFSFTLLILLSGALFGQQTNARTKLTFYKFDTGKKISLRKDKYVTITLLNSTDGIGNNDYEFGITHLLEGELLALNDTFLIIGKNYELLTIANKDSSYEQSTSIPNAKVLPFKISLNEIKYIEYTPKAGNVGAAIVGLSVFLAIFIAPLVSINYRTWDFNEDTYAAVMKPSLIGAVVGLTLQVSFATRRVTIKPSTH